MTIQISVLIFIFSLFIGSFYNVVALRTLSGDNFITKPSGCVHCGHKLNMLDMFPVLSYIFLGGKCRYCKGKLSYLYPVGEILTAISYTLVVWKFGFTLETIVQLILVTVLVLATITDLKEMIVPDAFTLIGLIAVTIFRLIQGEHVKYYLLSSIIAFGVLFLISLISRGKMGGADVKLYALIGLSLGLGNAVCSLFYASYLAVLYFIIKGIKRRSFKFEGKDRMVPFVPFILLGVLLTYLYNAYSFLNFYQM